MYTVHILQLGSRTLHARATLSLLYDDTDQIMQTCGRFAWDGTFELTDSLLCLLGLGHEAGGPLGLEVVPHHVLLLAPGQLLQQAEVRSDLHMYISTLGKIRAKSCAHSHYILGAGKYWKVMVLKRLLSHKQNLI